MAKREMYVCDVCNRPVDGDPPFGVTLHQASYRYKEDEATLPKDMLVCWDCAEQATVMELIPRPARPNLPHPDYDDWNDWRPSEAYLQQQRDIAHVRDQLTGHAKKGVAGSVARSLVEGAKITDIAQTATMTDEQLLNLRGIGYGSIASIRSAHPQQE